MRGVGEPAYLLAVGHVGRDRDHACAVHTHVVRDLLELRRGARREHEVGAVSAHRRASVAPSPGPAPTIITTWPSTNIAPLSLVGADSIAIRLYISPEAR